MIALRTAIHFITGEPVDRDTRRGILSGHWDQGSVVGAFCGKLGSFNSRPPLKSRRSPQAGERCDSVNRDLGVPLMK